eukprot:7974307-Ditylum_brightwellii.AAC.1
MAPTALFCQPPTRCCTKITLEHFIQEGSWYRDKDTIREGYRHLVAKVCYDMGTEVSNGPYLPLNPQQCISFLQQGSNNLVIEPNSSVSDISFIIPPSQTFLRWFQQSTSRTFASILQCLIISSTMTLFVFQAPLHVSVLTALPHPDFLILKVSGGGIPYEYDE